MPKRHVGCHARRVKCTVVVVSLTTIQDRSKFCVNILTKSDPVDDVYTIYDFDYNFTTPVYCETVVDIVVKETIRFIYQSRCVVQHIRVHAVS